MAPTRSGRRYAWAAAIVVGATAIASLLERHAEPSDLTMLYLLGVVIAAMAWAWKAREPAPRGYRHVCERSSSITSALLPRYTTDV